jgi:hypothetical protein
VGSSFNKTVTIQNTGATTMSFSSIGTPAAPFSIEGAGTTCLIGTPVAAGGSCNIVVKMAPTAFGTYNGSFDIISNAGNATVDLNGSAK